jgi:type IV secretory pathway protease TraF
VVIALITSFILFGHRLIVNRTHSLPVGLYYWSEVPIKKGSIVLFKPDQSTPLQQLRDAIRPTLDRGCRRDLHAFGVGRITSRRSAHP